MWIPDGKKGCSARVGTCIFTTESLVDVTEELDYSTIRYPTFREPSDPLIDSRYA